MDGSAPPAANAADMTASLDSLYRRYDRWLRSALRKRHGREVADDVATETFIRLAPHAAAGVIRDPKAFLLRIAHNLVIDRQRRDRVQAASEPFDETSPALRATPAAQDAALTLKQILMDLPPELRDVFVLNHIEGLTYREIAVTLGLPLTTVHHRMRQALARTAAAMRD